MELIVFLVQNVLGWKVITQFPVAFPSTQKCKSGDKCKSDFVLILISVSSGSRNVSDLIPVIQSPNIVRKCFLDTLEGVFDAVLFQSTEVNSAELTLETGSIVFQGIELSYRNISPMRYLDDSVYICEINLRIVINSVKTVLFNGKWLGVFLFEYHSVDSLGFCVLISFIIVASIRTELHYFVKLIRGRLTFNFISWDKVLVIHKLKLLVLRHRYFLGEVYVSVQVNCQDIQLTLLIRVIGPV